MADRTKSWCAAVARYEGGYDEPLDLTDEQARDAFLAILDDEIRRDLTSGIVAAFRKATAKLREQTTEEVPRVRP